MAKLSALVIPAVIDTSGIDKGVNSIRNKLSRVRGQGGTTGTGGFSSGLTPYGGHDGASGVGTAMAAAFGASAGSRGRSALNRDWRYDNTKLGNWSGVPRGGMRWAAAKGMTSQSTRKFMEMRLRNADFLSEYKGNDSASWEVRDAAEQGQKAYFDTITNQKKKQAAVRRGILKRKAGDIAFSPFKQEGGSGLLGLSRTGTTIAAGIGLIGMLGDKMGQRSQESTFGNLSRWEGSGDYQAALAIHQRSYERRATPTFWEQVMLQDQKNAAAAGKTEGGLSSFGSMFDTLKTLAANALAGMFDSPVDRIQAEAKREAASRGPQTRANNSIKSAFSN